MSGNLRLFWMAAFAFILFAVLSTAPITPALAQDEIPPEDSTCKTCHENLYLLHDTGKWYCFCGTRLSCTECHGGQVGTMDEDLAHAGMIVNPLVDDAALCQNCHPDNYQEIVEKFALIAGVSDTPHPCPTYVPAAQVIQPPDTAGPTRLLRGLPSGGWQVLGVIILGIAFISVFLFTCRCWRLDHTTK